MKSELQALKMMECCIQKKKTVCTLGLIVLYHICIYLDRQENNTKNRISSTNIHDKTKYIHVDPFIKYEMSRNLGMISLIHVHV